MFDEQTLEKVTIEMLQNLGYECINGYEMNRTDFSKIMLEEDLVQAIEKINKNIKTEQIQETVRLIRNLDHNNIILNNKQFTKYLLEGISVPIQENGETKYKTVKILDFNNIQNNTFKAINQYTIIEHSEKRPDIILFVNGLPLVIIELKSTVREEVKLEDGYNQLKGYQEVHIPSLFYYNQFIIVSDGVQARSGTITSPWSRFSEWKKVEDTDEVKENMPTHQTLFNGMLRKDRLLDIISNFILWSENSKILSAYHQYFGVKKAINSTEKAIDKKTGKAGLLWHTQGSGKSFSMVFYTGNMIKLLQNPSIVVVTDRNDLDNQLFTTFAKCSEYLKQEPVQIENRQDLNDKLEGRMSGGIFFTTLQKFEEETGIFSNRDDILVLVDEAHRSHYGLDAIIKLDKEKMKAYKKYGTAKYLHDAFPNATYIGFTGTPVETKEKSTTNIFGEIIDTYDMTQAIMDGATVPIMYESRMARVGLNQKILDEIDDYYTYLETEEDVEEYKIVESKKAMATMKQIIEDPDRLQMIVEDIIKHYQEIQNSVANKAMIVAYSRQSAYIMYNKFIELKPEWKNKVNMVITSNNKDDEEMQKAIGSKKDKKQLEVDFKDMDSEFKIAIVVDMWLTGFDVPSLGTMYIDKPMKAHNLMQAIARVNRVYKDKTGGLIVDYIGLKRWLLDALKTYTKRDQGKIVDNSELVKVLNDKVELIRDLFKGFHYGHFATTTDSDKYEIIMAGANWVLKTETTKKAFMKYSYDVKSLYSLCTGALSQEMKDEILFFISVRSFISKLSGEKIDVKEINENVAKMLERAIQDDEMLQIGEIHNSNRLALLSNEILNKIAKMQKKNIAVEVLNRVLKEYVEQVGKQNVVLMEKFSTKFQKIAAAYNERTSVEDIEKIIQEMINLKNEIEEELKAGNEYDLSPEEKAFFDALGDDPEVKELMQDEILVQIAKELVETVNKNMTIDWDVRKDARARMRIEIKKLLIKYDYPPNKSEKAVQTVIKQAELKCKEMVG
ncbi:MAG: type I restriction endonuclease subunit R [Clostridia bacterium]|nr:type I restriction endonuclease subunit R [Clostridia bacterium]